MRRQHFTVLALTFLLGVVGARVARADGPDEDNPSGEQAQPADEHPADEHPAPTDDHPTDDQPAPAADGDHTDDTPATAGTTAAAGDADDNGDNGDSADPYAGDTIPAALDFDADGDGKMEPEEAELAKETAEAFKDIASDVTELPPGGIDIQHPSMTPEQFKNLVRLAKAKVLTRLKAKMAKKQDAKMAKIGRYIAYFSLSGLLLLLLPLGLKNKYPGKTGMLFKYSGLAALTFIVTVNLFGGVVLGMRTAQGAVGSMTNPQLKVAEGFFDSLADGADKYVPLGKDLFGPTLRSLSSSSAGEGEQPIVALLDNGQKLMSQAKVFTSIAKTVKKMDSVFAAIPIVLLCVTMLLFVLALRPTLTEIIKMPGNVAAGEAAAGKAAVKNAGKRVVGEVWATLSTIGVLIGLSLIATVVLGRLLEPALDLMIQYFAVGVVYLQVKVGASTGLIFVSLIGVVIFLALNLAAIILGMAFFLGKAQKVFQARFHDKTPLAAHARFWKWGTASVLATMVVPLVFMLIAAFGIDKLNDKIIAGAADVTQIGWGKLLVIGPMILVFGFLLFFWAARGVKAIKFLFTYKVKPAVAKQPIEVVAAPGYAGSMLPSAPPVVTAATTSTERHPIDSERAR